MAQKVLIIDEKEVLFRATAATPRKYRVQFGNDILRDLNRLQRKMEKVAKEDDELDALDLTLFENVAYIMCADPEKPKTPDAWLDQFGMFDIYSILPELIDLWGMNLSANVPETVAEDGKK